MNILITGGAGAIGIHIVSYIMENSDWDVAILDSFQEKYSRKRIVKILGDNPSWTSRVAVYEHNLISPIPNKLKHNLKNINGIIHLAAMADVPISIREPVNIIKNNIDSTVTILEFARQIKFKFFIYFSTDQVYGPIEKGKTHKEWNSHRPSHPYAASKAASEDICYAYWKSYGIPLTIVNSSNNFGEMQSNTKFASIVQRKLTANEKIIIHGNKKELGTRFYIHSRNVADALFHIIKINAPDSSQKKVNDPPRYHIVGDKCLSNLDMTKVVAKIINKKFKYQVANFLDEDVAYDLHNGMKDNKLRSSGWKQPSDFISSMTTSVRWHQRNPKWIGDGEKNKT